MYSDYRLDTPPPSSRFRRPWSPDPQDSLPPMPQTVDNDALDTFQPGRYLSRQREPSDVSMEALDLADYAAHLRQQPSSHPQPDFNAYDSYPPSPRAGRPLASSPDSMQAPSLVSPSASSAPSMSEVGSRVPHRRPFSMPPPSFPQRSHPSLSASGRGHYDPYVRVAGTGTDSEFDIAAFPSFSRAWYEADKARAPPLSPPSLQGHGPGATKLSPFDPAYPTPDYYDSDPYTLSPPPSYNNRSSRDLVPWGSDPTEADAPVDPETKEERMRMLQAEFGGKQVGTPGEEDEEKAGSVDGKGKLITEGPKKRLAVRCIQVLLVIAACIASVYTGLIIKTTSTPPPKGKMPAYVLYVFSFITLLACIYMYMIHPCCCGARDRKLDSSFGQQGPGGLMVLPVQGLPGGKKPKGKKNKKGAGGPGEGVQVNLIVDPTMFGGGGGRDRDREEWGDEEEGEEGSVPGTFEGSGAGRKRAPRRRGIFAGLAMEAQWKRARKQLKVQMAFDCVMALVWGVVFVVILLGKRCPVGGYLGWCDGYNVGTATAFLLCFAFCFSIFFDIKDLHASKASPRTRS